MTKETLIILLKHIKDLPGYGGLCALTTQLHRKGLLDWEEYEDVRFYIRMNRPNIYSSIGAFINRNEDFFWPAGWKRPRIKWLKKHIKKLS